MNTTNAVRDVPVSPTEFDRLVTLQSYDILDTPAEEVFDEFARLAASIVGTPIALVSLVDGNRQWFKAKVGLTASETLATSPFCAHAIGSADVFVIPDALKDERFVDNPLVTGGPMIRFYAGAPLMSSDGKALGTLCVIDYIPRDITAEQRAALQILSRHVMAQLELRRRLVVITRGDVSRQQTIGALRGAVEAGEFILHYQPKVDIRSGRIVGLEALAPLEPGGRGLISPAEFRAASGGVGTDSRCRRLGAASIGCRLPGLQKRGLNPPPIAVNVSPLQIRHPDFVPLLQQVLGADGESRTPLDIEITEGVLMEKTDEVIQTLCLDPANGCACGDR